MLTFTEWKDKQVKKDSKEHNVFLYFRLREWYWQAYGNYCKNLKGIFK